MSEMGKLWAVVVTRDKGWAGTLSDFFLVCCDEGKAEDLYNVPIRNRLKNHPVRGEATFYYIGTPPDVNPPPLRVSTPISSSYYFRFGIRGKNLWRPHDIFLWGETMEGEVLPLAHNFEIDKVLSTDSDEGVVSIPLQKSALGQVDMQIKELLLVVSTASATDAGTSPLRNKVLLTIKAQSTEFSGYFPKDTTTNQTFLRNGGTNMYRIECSESFSKNQIGDKGISLKFEGKDKWCLGSIAIFGLDSTKTSFVPLVNMIDCDKWMSEDSDEGKNRITLKLV
jgi:hypothetical protein